MDTTVLARDKVGSLFAGASAAFLTVVMLVACAGDGAEPSVPTATASQVNGIVKVPISGDGTLDTAGMARFSFGESRHEFGNVDEGKIVTQRFAFTNVGRRPLVISHASSTCGCTVPSWPREPIAPGDTASIGVRFDTEGKAGPQVKAITLTANTYPNTTQLQLLGTVDARN